MPDQWDTPPETISFDGPVDAATFAGIIGLKTVPPRLLTFEGTVTVKGIVTIPVCAEPLATLPGFMQFRGAGYWVFEHHIWREVRVGGRGGTIPAYRVNAQTRQYGDVYTLKTAADANGRINKTNRTVQTVLDAWRSLH